ncbi:MAG: Rieske (2Fe-2S) protein [Candidatus Methylacidiphilales bacterium]
MNQPAISAVPASASTSVSASPTPAFRHAAGPADMKEGERRIVMAGNISIGIFRVRDRYYAIRNHCPHEGAELCRGRLTGTMLPATQPRQYEWGRDNMILRCPWHQWEFDLETGRHVANPRLRVRTWRVVEENCQLFLEI